MPPVDPPPPLPLPGAPLDLLGVDGTLLFLSVFAPVALGALILLRRVRVKAPEETVLVPILMGAGLFGASAWLVGVALGVAPAPAGGRAPGLLQPLLSAWIISSCGALLIWGWLRNGVAGPPPGPPG